MNARIIVVVLAALGAGCPAAYSYAKNAPPIDRTVALVEASPAVAAALGDTPRVSLVVTRTFRRDIVKHEGRDRINLDTTIRGARAQGRLEVDAVNVREQGWAGRFAVTVPGAQVLVDGNYVTRGGGTLLEGTFAADGTPIVATPAQP